MLVYNTTYHIEEKAIANFLIWIKESYIPEVMKTELLSNPRLCKVLSHNEAGSETYTLQWEVESSGILHRWHQLQGAELNKELTAIFKEKVVGLPTLLEVID